MIDKLLAKWRERGPVWWAGHKYGWLMETGKPIVLEPWQRAILQAWWEHRETVTTLALSNVKKTGKTTTNAVLTCWRWLAIPGEHLCAANDRDQSESRQFAMVAEMCRRHPLLKQHVRETQRKLTFEPTGSTLEAIEVDAPGRAGSNHWTVSHTEAWGILYESAVRAWEELTPPPGRRFGFPALRIADSYAGWEGESETWHALADRGLTGDRVGGDWPIFLTGGLLLLHLEGAEGQERCFRGTAAEREAYYAEQRETLRENSYRRLHKNERTASESVFILPEMWDALVDDDYRCPGSGVNLVVGLDASVRHDATAAVSVYKDGGDDILLGPYRIWTPHDGQEIDFDAVFEYILELRRPYYVLGVVFDPFQLQYLSQRLKAKGVRTIEFAQTVSNLTQAGNRLFDCIKQRRLVVYPGSDDLRKHVLSASARETSRGVRLVKSASGAKIDAGISLAMATMHADQKRGVLLRVLDI